MQDYIDSSVYILVDCFFLLGGRWAEEGVCTFHPVALCFAYISFQLSYFCLVLLNPDEG